MLVLYNTNKIIPINILVKITNRKYFSTTANQLLIFIGSQEPNNSNVFSKIYFTIHLGFLDRKLIKTFILHKR